eukprot:CAMPEP_0181038814 /NCGR_PEP_ID=MMETSP1070-20121207/10130_1 /TAXON_ID=265543 /ORGANISM="Minutocellus polymorphus, Strain NH13" /LENGTH=298 /DNA_ID=CAMNT_0023116611 /DNA_START=201 /DNA_END=1097 /DNA_ORIENTATION=-
MTKTQNQGGNNHHSYSRTTGHHQSKGPHKGKKTAGKRRLNYGGFGGAGGKSGGHNFGNKTTKENAFKAGYRKTGKAATPKPFVMDGEVVPKLDQNDPVQARRIQQRAKMIMFGKNTAGYDEYIKQVPKETRRPRCMDHPTTPDHTLDIPNRRWQGMVKAWRRALHKYDPADLKNADVHKPQDPLVAAMASTFAATAVMGQGGEKKGALARQNDDGGVQAKQIADAASSGLLVDFGVGAASLATTTAAASQGVHEQEEERYEEMIQQAEEEGTDDLVAFAGKSTGDDVLDDVDSDDDLL